MENFIKEGRAFILFGLLAFFGMAFVSLSYLLGFIFTKPETAFKWSPGLGMLIYALPTALSALFAFVINSPSLAEAMPIVLNFLSPFTNLSTAISNLLLEQNSSGTSGSKVNKLSLNVAIFMI